MRSKLHVVNFKRRNRLGVMKSRKTTNIHIPDGFRHIDWVTYGLYWLTRLANDPNSRCDRIKRLLTSRCSYAVEDIRPAGTGPSIHADLVSDSTPVYEKWNMHKQLSAGIRHAFLTGANVDLVTQCLDAAHPHGHRSMNFYLADGSSFSLRRLIEDEAAGAAVIQDARPNEWYNLPSWRGSDLQEITDIPVSA